jgi:hypothetical protein
MAYRYWCGECGFKTPWLSEAQGEQQQIEHYTKRHPGIPPGGHVEVNRRNPNGDGGCLRMTTMVVLLLLIAASAIAGGRSRWIRDACVHQEH